MDDIVLEPVPAAPSRRRVSSFPSIIIGKDHRAIDVGLEVSMRAIPADNGRLDALLLTPVAPPANSYIIAYRIEIDNIKRNYDKYIAKT